jgi:hypothetical protein
MKAANYNSLSPMRDPQKRLGLAIVLVVLCSCRCFAANWTAPTIELAKAISAASGPGTITLAVGNNSSLPADQVQEIQHAIEAQLRSSGVRVGSAANANSEVRVTLSENVQDYVWVAEIKSGSELQVEMVSVPRPPSAAVAHSAPTVTIRKTLLWSQGDSILDALLLDSTSTNPRLLVLDTTSLSVYILSSGKWQRTQGWDIFRNHNFPRDPRGLIALTKDHLADIYLPGTVCNISNGSTTAISCHDGDDPWPLGGRSAFFNSARNYFTGALVPPTDKPLGPFYSLAAIDKSSYALSIFSSVDGRVRVTDGVNERTWPTSITSDWGSDLAAVKSGCGTGAQLLVTNAGDDTSGDSLRAYEIPDREPVLVSAALEFAGPITALWTHEGSSTVAIHNLKTGQYEAYAVSINCNQ